ncbi:MAG TPA: hypothetical protein PKV72_06735, partial [Candidatus Peribacteria bacterium]|nr:hypothetical protein [Candidatus Peribacteria bacterium]
MSKLLTVLTGLLVSAALAVPALADAAGYYGYQYYQPNTYNNTYDTQYDYDRYPASYQQQFQHLYGDTYGNYCGYYDGYYRCPTDSDYQRSYQYNSPVYRPVTSSYEALPDYYQDYLTPPPA